jgi:hypothetical protein
LQIIDWEAQTVIPSFRQQRWLRVLCCILACSLIAPVSKPLGAAPQEVAPQLKIVILEGDGAVNNVRQRTARDPVVEVRDENDRPVAGAVVTFLLPDRGPGAVFSDGAKSLSVTTDAQGRAVATGLQANTAEGNYQIRVTASHEGQTAGAVISQTNVLAAAAAGIAAGKLALILAIVGGAAAGGVYAATRSDNGSITPPPARVATISPGSPAVGAPR